MSQSPSENPINPWASSLTESDASPLGVDIENYSVTFSGRLDSKKIAEYFGSHWQIGCVVPLVLLSAIIWGAVLAFGLGPIGPFIVVVASLLVFWFLWVRYVGKNHAKRLLKRRPWLQGAIRGDITSGRLTVWHEDLCLQSSLYPFMINPKRGMICYPDVENTFPWAMIPSTCFFEDQWYELMAVSRQPGTPQSRVAPATPADGWEWRLEFNRSLTLRNRIKALSWRPNLGIFLLFVVLGLWLSFIPNAVGYQQGVSAIPGVMLVGWVMTEIARFALARAMVYREYSNPQRQAYRKTPLNQWPQAQWFSPQQVLFCEMQHWVLCPVRYVQKVKVRDSWIEFRIGGESILFHREGFANEEAWQGACRDASAIQRAVTERV